MPRSCPGGGWAQVELTDALVPVQEPAGVQESVRAAEIKTDNRLLEANVKQRDSIKDIRSSNNLDLKTQKAQLLKNFEK